MNQLEKETHHGSAFGARRTVGGARSDYGWIGVSDSVWVELGVTIGGARTMGGLV